MPRITTSKNFYIAERDENSKGVPSLQIVSHDQKQDYWFLFKNNFWVLTHHNQKTLDPVLYAEVRELAKESKPL
jgi:hypothetical protein